MPVDPSSDTAELRHRRRSDSGTVLMSDAGPPPSSGPTHGPNVPPPDFTGTGCEVCTVAQTCCDTVDPSGSCSFSAATCLSYPPSQQPNYYISCRVFLRTVWSAWGGSPPASCDL
jgi:hypothetical protein